MSVEQSLTGAANNRWKHAKNIVSVRLNKEKEMRKVVRNSPALAESLTDPMIEKLVKESESQEYEDGAFIFKQGDSGDGMYIVQEGQVEILRLNDGVDVESEEYDSEDLSNYHLLIKLHPGGLFGETSLLVDAPRNAAARCVLSGEGVNANAHVVFISRALYLKLQGNNSRFGENLIKAKSEIMKHGIMDRVECFKELTAHQKELLLEVMRPIEHAKGKYICKQGERGYTLHVVIQGEVVVTVNDNTGEKQLVRLGPNNFFGEIALLSDDCIRTANCIADTMGKERQDSNNIDTTTLTMVLHKSSFDQIIKGEVLENMRNNADAARLGLLQSSRPSTAEVPMRTANGDTDDEDNAVLTEQQQTLAATALELSAYNFIDSKVFRALSGRMTKRCMNKYEGLTEHIYLGKESMVTPPQNNTATTDDVVDSVSVSVSNTTCTDATAALTSTLSLPEIKEARKQIAQLLRNVLKPDKIGTRTNAEV